MRKLLNYFRRTVTSEAI